jgi:hypothetical protein
MIASASAGISGVLVVFEQRLRHDDRDPVMGDHAAGE